MLRVGLVGTGVFARTHAEAWKNIPGVELVGVCGSCEDRRRAFAAVFGIPHFTCVEELLGYCDVLDVVSQNHVHSRQALAAISRGRHVIVEKPIALDSRTAWCMAAAAQERGVRHATINQMRFTEAVLAFRQLLRSGRIGKPTLCRITGAWPRRDAYYLENDGWRADIERSGGGVLIHHFIHYLDLALWFFGDMNRIERCSMELDPVFGVERAFQADVGFATGVKAILRGSSQENAEGGKSIHVTGTMGDARLCGCSVACGQAQAGEEEFAETLHTDAVDPLRRLLHGFIRAVEQKSAFHPSLEDGAKCLTATDALYRAARSGGAIEESL